MSQKKDNVKKDDVKRERRWRNSPCPDHHQGSILRACGIDSLINPLSTRMRIKFPCKKQKIKRSFTHFLHLNCQAIVSAVSDKV